MKITHILLSRYDFYKKLSSQLQFLSCEVLRVSDEPEEKAYYAFHAIKKIVQFVLDESDTSHDEIEFFMKLLVLIFNHNIPTNHTQHDLILVLIRMCQKKLGIKDDYYYFRAQEVEKIDEYDL